MNKKWISFNPLHCGAVVASKAMTNGQARQLHVSIPFIAGQWSLLMDGFAHSSAAAARFNPLHCGAVVASRAPAS